MRRVTRHTAFRRDLKKARKQKRHDFELLEDIINKLVNGEQIPPAHRPHPVRQWPGFWELHIQGDWLLLYKVTDDEVILARLASHSELYG